MNNKYVVEITPQGCGKVFNEFGEVTTNDSRLTKTPELVSLVVFTGGHDVTPALYGENKGRHTYNSVERDEYEGRMFDIALKHKIPMVGICRGAQFLCVKAGGKLVQDINNHGGWNHEIRTNENKVLICNSSHHQMQLPPKNAIPLAWAEPKISDYYLNGDNKKIEVDKEYEVVYYPNIRAISAQFHPEWVSSEDECVKYCQDVVRKYLFNETNYEKH